MTDMSKTNPLFGAPQAVQPVTASAGEQAQPNSAGQPDLEALIEKAFANKVPQAIDRAFETYSRKQQSQRDQQEARINKKLNDTLSTLKASGVEITPGLQSAIQQQVVREESAVDQPSQPSQPTPGQVQATGSEGDMGQKYTVRNTVQTLLGVTFENGDPELANFKDTSDMDELAKQLIEIGTAKKKRLEQGASGRLGVLPSSGPSPTFNPIADINDPSQLISMGLQQLRKK